MKIAKDRSWRAEDTRYQRVAEKRALILRAAQHVFLRSGYERTSMDVIAQEAGVSKMTVYRHFSDKSGLFVACMNDRCRAMLAPERYAEAKTLEEARASLLEYGRVVFDLITQEEILLLYRILIGQVGQFKELAEFFYKSGPVEAYHIIEKIICRLFDENDVPLIAHTIFWGSLGDAYNRTILGVNTSAEARTAFLTQIELVVDSLLYRACEG